MAVGIAWFEAADEGDRPAKFVAVTVNVYTVPSVNPSKVHRKGPNVHWHVRLPWFELTS
jgi:hypothetical protein